MNPEIYDVGDGINMVLHVGEGFSFTVYMTDQAAEEMCSIIENKLNGRFP